MTNQELSVLKNTIEQMASDAEDRGERDFCIQLTVDDAFALCKLKPVSPAAHGKWERVANPNWPAHIHDKCSICGWWNTRNALCYDGSNKPGHSLNYCPNCGAKMDGGAE